MMGAPVIFLGEKAHRLQRGHAAHAGGGHRLAIDVVGHVASGVDPLDSSGGGPSLNRLAYFPTVAISTTKESHMTHQLCAFARGPVAAGMTRG